MPLCGYVHVIESLNLAAPPPRRAAEASNAVNRRVIRGNRLLLPIRSAPKNDSILEHLLFALKHEGVNLAVLSEALPHVPGQELQQRLNNDPLSEPLRKAAFLWEHFNHDHLEIRRPIKSWVQLFNPRLYITGSSRKNERWKLDFNGVGDLSYCPTVEKTDLIQTYLNKDILQRTNQWFSSIGSTAAERALEWAYLNETRGTYALERESPSADRSRRFVELLRHAHEDQNLSEEYLCDLQNQVVASIHNHAYSWRTEQNWLSRVSGRNALSVTYVPPSPEALDELMDSYLSMVNSWTDAVDPVVKAAIASFGFVYLHPFMDGNGRLSRFLLHRELARSPKLAHGLLLPVSVAMKSSEEAYLQALTTFSSPVRRFWDVTFCGGEPPYIFNFKGTSNLYRYWDGTAQVEFVFRMAEEALDVHLQEEVDYLEIFDEICRRVEERFDLRQSHLFTLVGSAIDRNGILSRTIRKRFADKVEPEAMDFIEEAARRVLARQTDDLQSPVD